MADVPEREDYGSSEALLKMIQERSDDIERAEIVPPGFVLTYRGRPEAPPLPHFGMMLYFISGDRKMIFHDDVAIVLNDGILNRMGIRIELAKGSL